MALLQLVACPVCLCKRLIYHHLLRNVICHFYLSFVWLQLEYCSAVWGGAPKAVLVGLEPVKLYIARAVCNSHLSGLLLLQDVNVPTLTWRQQEHHLVLLWRLFNH